MLMRQKMRYLWYAGQLFAAYLEEGSNTGRFGVSRQAEIGSDASRNSSSVSSSKPKSSA